MLWVCLLANEDSLQVSEYHRINPSRRDFNLFINLKRQRWQGGCILLVDIRPLDSLYSL